MLKSIQSLALRLRGAFMLFVLICLSTAARATDPATIDEAVSAGITTAVTKAGAILVVVATGWVLFILAKMVRKAMAKL